MNILTCKNLIAMGRHIPTPFYLAIADEHGETMLKIESVLRIIPGKRIVALSTWKEQTMLVKIFFRRGHWKQSMLRDLTGLTLLRQATIPTPKIFSQTTTADKNGAILFIEYLQQGTSLLQMFRGAKEIAEQISIVEMGIESIARCHRAGLWQNDLHLDNFMLSKGNVYVLDGGDIKGTGGSLGIQESLKNLGVFISQFPTSLDSHIPDFLARYLELISATTESVDDLLPQIKKNVVVARKRRLQILEGKLFRSTSAHRMIQTFNRFAVYDRTIHSDDLEQFIRNPDTLLSSGKMLKKGDTSTVVMIQFGGRDYVLKRYNIKSFTHGLKRLFQPSRAHKSWRNGSVLELLGIATPRPFAMIEERVFWLFRRRAWFLCEYINGENLLQQLEHDIDSIPMPEVLEQFKALLVTMKTYNINHGDMKASNFIYRNRQLYVFDLDAMSRHRSSVKAQKLIQKDIARFARNWTNSPLDAAVQKMISEIKPVTAE